MDDDNFKILLYFSNPNSVKDQAKRHNSSYIFIILPCDNTIKFKRKCYMKDQIIYIL